MRIFTCSMKFEGWCKYFSPIKLVSLWKLAPSRNLVCTRASLIRMAWLCHWNIGNCEEELPKKPVGRLSVNCRPSVGRLLAVCWPTVGRLSAVCWPTVCRLSASIWPTGFPQNIDYQSADSWPTVGDVSVTCRYNVITNLAVFALCNIQTVWYTDKNRLSLLVMVITAQD